MTPVRWLTLLVAKAAFWALMAFVAYSYLIGCGAVCRYGG